MEVLSRKMICSLSGGGRAFVRFEDCPEERNPSQYWHAGALPIDKLGDVMKSSSSVDWRAFTGLARCPEERHDAFV